MEAGGGRAPLCCLLCHCSPPTPCLPPPPRVCPPGAPRGGEVGAGGGGGCCAHWETFRNWENSAGVVPPPPLPVCPLQPGVGGGEKGCVPSWFQWGGGHCRPVEHLIPMVWVGAVSPPTPTPTGTDTQTAWGASTSWGDNFFLGGDDRGWRHRPWLHPATPGGGPAELGVTPTSIGGGCIEPPHRQRGHCPHPGDLRCRAPAMAIPCWEQRMVGRGWSGGARNLKIPDAARCRDHPPLDWVAAGPSCPFETPGR